MRKLVILTVCLSILTALFTHLSPISYAEDSTAIIYDGTAQSFLLLNENETEVLSLSKVSDVEASYQWEILIDEENGTWVELENQTDDQYEAVYQTLRELVSEEDDTIQLRCRITVNEEVSYSNVLDVELFENSLGSNTFSMRDDSESDIMGAVYDEYGAYNSNLVLNYEEFFTEQAIKAYNTPQIYEGFTATFSENWLAFQVTDTPETTDTPSSYTDVIEETDSEEDDGFDDYYEVLFDDVADLKVIITEAYLSELTGLLWYKVEAAEGYTLPEVLVEYPYVLQQYYEDDRDFSLLFEPRRAMFTSDSVIFMRKMEATSSFVAVSADELGVFFDVSMLESNCDFGTIPDIFGNEWYDVSVFGVVDNEVEYNYVYANSIQFISPEVSAAYDTLLDCESIVEYFAVYKNIPEEIRNQFTNKHEAYIEAHFNHIYAIENAVVVSSVVINGVEVPVKVKGKIPEDVSLNVTPVTTAQVISEGFKLSEEDIVVAMDIKLINDLDGTEWQPEEGSYVDLMIGMGELGYADERLFSIYHKHGDQINKNELFMVEDGYLTMTTGGFSLYVVSNFGSTTNTATRIAPDTTIELEVGDEVYYYIFEYDVAGSGWGPNQTPSYNEPDWDGNNAKGTWRVNDPSGAIHYVVYDNIASNNVGHNQVNAQWIRIVALKETTTNISLSYTNGTNTESYSLKIVTPKAEVGTTKLYLKDTVNTSGCITATLVNSAGEPQSLEGASFKWERDDKKLIVPFAYEDDYQSVNIARDHGGLVEARKKADGSGYEPITYKCTVTLPDSTTREAEYTVYYQSEIINSGFEFPAASDSTYNFFPNGWPELYWKTTAPGTGTANITKDVEYGDVTDGSGNLFGVTRAADYDPVNRTGYQFAELNAEEFGALYQDIITAPGEVIDWSFVHAPRNENSYNRMYIVIGPTEGAQVLNIDQLKSLCQSAKDKGGNDFRYNGQSVTATDVNGVEYTIWYHDANYNFGGYGANNNYGWAELSGEYLVKADSNQYRTRIFFMTDAEGQTS
ncbi:MAG: hypothetical protein IKU28_03775, partial [Erysipelotrichaceae bacterium]|nr:hypothetical protein [Erysipelotrichaceae bacterium]